MELHQTLTCLYSMLLAKGITSREDLGGTWGLKHPLQILLICYITRKIVEATVVVSKAYTWAMKRVRREELIPSRNQQKGIKLFCI